jgi:site-specific recombinase XerD
MVGQLDLFKRKNVALPVQTREESIGLPTGESSVFDSLSAYYTHLQSVSTSQYTPDDFKADVQRFGVFVSNKKLQDISMQDIQQWRSSLTTSQGKPLSPKTISRKMSALINYFAWLIELGIIIKNPIENIRNFRVTSPLPDILFESECEALQKAASSDPRTYLLILLFLETGIKKEELFNLHITHFDFSNRYAPEVWIKHEGKKVKKDRKLKLPVEIISVFEEYIGKYGITDQLFPYTQRFIEMLLTNVAQWAKIKKKVNASILRDTFAVRQLRRGESMELVLRKLGLSESTWEDAKEKYLKLSSRGI